MSQGANKINKNIDLLCSLHWPLVDSFVGKVRLSWLSLYVSFLFILDHIPDQFCAAPCLAGCRVP